MGSGSGSSRDVTPAIDGPKSVELFEYVDKEIVEMIIAGSVGGVSERERECVERYKRGCSYNGQNFKKKVTYKFGKNGEDKEMGRWNAAGASLQGMSRRLRNLLAGGLYVDVDMVNAQPRLLLQMCEREGWPCDALRHYVEHRDTVLSEVMAEKGFDRDGAKEEVTAIAFGREAPPPAALREFASEMQRTLQRVHDAHPEFAAALQKATGRTVNLKGSVTAWVLQTVERKCLEAMREALKKHGYDLQTLIHDGGLVRVQGGLKELPSDVLRDVEASVHEGTGYHIQLLCKPMETDIVLPPRPTEDYAKCKAEFERWHCKVGSLFLKLGDGDGEGLQVGWKFMEERIMRTTYRHKRLVDDSAFMDKWLTDRDIRFYTAGVFWPPGFVHERGDESRNVFNLWPGLAVERLPQLTEEEACSAEVEAGVQRVLGHIRFVICSDDEDLDRYILGYIAKMLKEPGNKHGVPVLGLVGTEGAGKDLFVSALQNLVGWELTFTTSSWEDVVGKYTMQSANKLLVWVQEGGLADKPDLVRGAKNRITASKVRFEEKHVAVVNLDDCARIINTTNDSDSIPLGGRDRHYCMVHVSDKHVGDVKYFEDLARSINDPLVQRKLFDYFTTTDELLDGWQGSRYPRTRLHEDLTAATANVVAQFAVQWMQKYTGDTATVLVSGCYEEYKAYCSRERPGKDVLTLAQFFHKLKHDAWLGKALVRTYKTDHNTKTWYDIDIPAWRAEFVKNKLLKADATVLLPAAAELGVEVDSQAATVSAGASAVGVAGARAPAAVESDF